MTDHALLFELLDIIHHLGPKDSVSSSREAFLLTLVTFVYVLEHLWFHLPWYFDPVPTSMRPDSMDSISLCSQNS